MLGLMMIAGMDAAVAGTRAEDAALEASNRRLRGMVDSCRNTASVTNASGRIEVDAQAHAGEMVSLMIHSELGSQALVDCFCTRVPIALRDWLQAVEGDALISLPFILTPQDGSAGYSTSRESHTCRTNLASITSEPTPEPELPAGSIIIKRLKAKGALDSEAVTTELAGELEELERCYRADLIRWPGYADTAELSLQVEADGHVSAARIDGLAYNSISNCQVQHLLTVTLPASSGTSRATARLIYAAGD
jgi:hypothetical protein